MNNDRFPVVDERALLPTQRRWLIRVWRDPAELPSLRPGCVYVFASTGRYGGVALTGPFTGAERALVEANWVSVVNRRARRITVRADVPSTDPSVDFTVLATFVCRVVEPVDAAASGLTDLRGDLESRLRHEPTVTELYGRRPIDDVHAVRIGLSTALAARFGARTMTIAGTEIDFQGVQVHTPDGLRQHHARLRDMNWSEIEEHQRQKVELAQVDYTVGLLISAERAEAAAVARQETKVGGAADRMYAARDKQTEQLVNQVEEWLKADEAKRAPIDRRRLAEALFVRLVGGHLPPRAELVDLVKRPDRTTRGTVNGTVNGAAEDAPRIVYIPPADQLDGN